MTKYYMGIDPGNKGAIVVLDKHGMVDCRELPIVDVGYKSRKGANNILDLGAYSSYMRSSADCFGHRNLLVAIEQQQVRPGQGVSSSGKTMHAFGMLKGVCAGLALYYIVPRPVVWQKELLVGIDGENPKERSIKWCQQNLPDLNLTPGRKRTPHDGLADAACIASWLKMKREG